MTDRGKRGALPPLGIIRNFEISHILAFVAGLRTLLEGVTLSRMGRPPKVARELIEATRRILFSDGSASAVDHDAPRSEITAFLVSCRRIFSVMKISATDWARR